MARTAPAHQTGKLRLGLRLAAALVSILIFIVAAEAVSIR
jgi:hypothetical protein